MNIFTQNNGRLHIVKMSALSTMVKRIRITPVVKVDSLCNVMEFCKAKERRQLSCVARDFKEAFYTSRKTCAMIAMKTIVRDRRDRFFFDGIASPDELLVDVLPDVLRRHQMAEYLDYQIDAMFARYYQEGMGVNAFFDIIHESFHMTDLLKFRAVLKLIEGFVTHMTYEEIPVSFYFTFSTGDRYDQLLEHIEENNDETWDILAYTGEICNCRDATYLCSFEVDLWDKRGLSFDA